tara:strand:+ start:108 stop:950 length:843 start_codon:yes stop_codon:yes gene_type:complete
MIFNKNLAAIHGYLCSDGYVIKNSDTQKHKYYHIGLRNTNETLLKDFQLKFDRVFGLKPTITNGRSSIHNKELYYFLTKDFSYYSYEWKLPDINKENLIYWLRTFFDCEGWVENQPAKSRLIGADCCNEDDLWNIKKALNKLDIESQIKKRKGRTIWRLTICNIANLKRFHKTIKFLHPDKNKKLIDAIDSYKDYYWEIPDSKENLIKFIKEKGRFRESRNEIRFMSIKRQNLIKLKKALNKYYISSKIFGPWKNNTGSLYYCLTIKQEGGNKLWQNVQK